MELNEEDYSYNSENNINKNNKNNMIYKDILNSIDLEHDIHQAFSNLDDLDLQSEKGLLLMKLNNSRVECSKIIKKAKIKSKLYKYIYIIITLLNILFSALATIFIIYRENDGLEITAAILTGIVSMNITLLFIFRLNEIFINYKKIQNKAKRLYLKIEVFLIECLFEMVSLSKIKELYVKFNKKLFDIDIKYFSGEGISNKQSLELSKDFHSVIKKV